MKSIFSIVKILVIAYFSIAIIIYFFQRAFLYFPQKGLGIVTEKEVAIRNERVVLRGWVLNEGKEKAILYFGGNAERIENNIALFKDIFSEYTVYLINYRGYGISDGRPTEANLYKDAIHIYDEIKDKHNKISLIGRSLGTGVATYTASKRPTDKLVLIAPYDSIKKMAQQIFWMYPVSIMLKDKFESDCRVKEISSETMIMIAENDEIIPRRRTELLISQFKPEQLTVKIIDGATHNTISIFPEFFKSLKLFFK